MKIQSLIYSLIFLVTLFINSPATALVNQDKLINSRLNEAKALIKSADEHAIKNSTYDAIEELQQAIVILQELNRAEDEVGVWLKLAHCYIDIDNYATSLEYYKKALNIAQKLNNQQQIRKIQDIIDVVKSARLKRIEEIKRDILPKMAHVDARIQVIKELRTIQRSPQHTLESINERIPVGLKLTSLKQNGNYLILVGNAPSGNIIKEFAKDIEFSGGLFSDVSILTETISASETDASSIRFTLKAIYHPEYFIFYATRSIKPINEIAADHSDKETHKELNKENRETTIADKDLFLFNSIDNNQMVYRDLSALETHYHNTHNELLDLRELLPEDKEISKVYESLQKNCQYLNMVLKRFESRFILQNGSYKEISSAVQIMGSYHNLSELFEYLISNHRIINIDNLEVDKIDEQTKDININIRFNLTTFFATEQDVNKVMIKPANNPDIIIDEKLYLQLAEKLNQQHLSSLGTTKPTNNNVDQISNNAVTDDNMGLVSEPELDNSKLLKVDPFADEN